ncbi:MAG: CDP-alcohol phosphatidyltransferase family protein [Bacteroidota bacterium]
MTSERIVTLPTLFSILRVGLLVPLAYCLFTEFPGSRLWAVAIIAVGIVTDFLDGFFARRWHQVSEIGKIVDPLADKIAVGGLAVFLVVLGDIPLWFVVAVLVRDLLILAGALYIRRTKQIITQSSWPGKVAVTLIALVLLLAALREPMLEGVSELVLWSCVVLMIFSLLHYAQRLFIGRNVKSGESEGAIHS